MKISKESICINCIEDEAWTFIIVCPSWFSPIQLSVIKTRLEGEIARFLFVQWVLAFITVTTYREHDQDVGIMITVHTHMYVLGVFTPTLMCYDMHCILGAFWVLQKSNVLFHCWWFSFQFFIWPGIHPGGQVGPSNKYNVNLAVFSYMVAMVHVYIIKHFIIYIK